MLGLETVRLGAMLESSHQTLLLQQCSAPASLCQPVAPPGPQESQDHQLGKEDTAHLNSAGQAQSPLQGKVASLVPRFLPGPCQASWLYQEVIFPFPPIFGKQVSLLR